MSDGDDMASKGVGGLPVQASVTEHMNGIESAGNAAETGEPQPTSVYLQYSQDVFALDPNGPPRQPRVIANFSTLPRAPYNLTTPDAAVTTLYLYCPEALDMFLSRDNRHVMWNHYVKTTRKSLLIIRNLGLVEVGFFDRSQNFWELMVEYEVKANKWKAISATGGSIGWYRKDGVIHPSTSTDEVQKRSLARLLARKILEFRSWLVLEDDEENEITFEKAKWELWP